VGDDVSQRAADANASALDASAPPAPTAAGKILTKDRLLALRDRARREGRRVVHCHGCFDIVHPGHLRHLRHAKAQGDILLVTITGDSLINKGNGRPLIPQELRAENLAALDCVDWVYIEPRPTAAELLNEVRPDVYVKGKEYELNDDPRFAQEKETVLRHGGKVFFSSGDVVFSSTALIAALEQSADPYHARLRELVSRSETAPDELSRIIASFRGKRVVVVGETIRDTYVLCDRPEVAGESPIMTLRPVERRTYDGGAAIIARHLAAMGASPILVTLLPDTEDTAQFRQRLMVEGVQVRAITTGAALPEKQRFLVGAQKVMKLDLLERYELDESTQRELLNLALESAGGGAGWNGTCDAAIVADFGLGMWNTTLLGKLLPQLRKRAAILGGDVSGKRSNLRAMRDMDVVCPSESELRDSLGLFDQGLGLVAWRFLAETRSKAAIVTMGPEGLIAFDRLPEAAAKARENAGGWNTRIKAEHVPALSSHAIDPLGCGDAMLATITLSLAGGASLLSAGFLGAAAAAVQVQRLGNTVVGATDLRQVVTRVHAAHLAYTPPEVIDSRVTFKRAVTV
jgi:rfaE bifunctional protein nucleotidyltransferase chain/domain